MGIASKSATQHTFERGRVLPRHIAIIMDGNGRWAKEHNLPRIAGHKAGSQIVKKIITKCAEKRIAALTLFAFSTENWQRPKIEVKFLMEAFFNEMQKQAKDLVANNIKFNVIGDLTRLSKKLQAEIAKVQELTAKNDGLCLNVAINYSGRWDILHAVQLLLAKAKAENFELQDITAELFQQYLSLSELPSPDLLIRTSGELRISNFMLWQLAYTELYFTDVYWPDFDELQLEMALDAFAMRQRRYGKVVES